MHETTLVSRSAQGLRCEVCQWRCLLADGEWGRCGVRQRQDQTITVHNHGLVSAATIGPVEDYGFRHFFPGASVFAIGGWGTSFPAHHDAAYHAQIPTDPAKQRSIEPERVVGFSQERMTRGIVWAYNEPTMNFEHVLETARLARSTSRMTGMVTNGYWSKAALDQLAPYIDGLMLTVYGLSDASYKALTGVEQWQGIFAGAEHAVKRWGCHLEITTPIVTGVNDSSAEIEGIARWIKRKFNGLIPWRIIPSRDADTNAATSVRKVAQGLGLPFVYGAQPTETTRCPKCEWAVIERFDGQPRVVGVNESQCENCGSEVYIRSSLFKRNKLND